MISRIVVAVLIFAAVFAVTVWLLSERGPLPGRGASDLPERPAQGPSVSPPPVDMGGDSPDLAPKVIDADVPKSAPSPPAAADASKGARGSLVGEIKGPNGPVWDIGVRLIPDSGRVVSAKGGRLEVQDIVPGVYHLTVYADGFVAQSFRGYEIPAGGPKRLDLTLEPGVRPAGIVVDEMTNRGVPGVIVEFAGVSSRLRTDAEGRFEAAWVYGQDSLVKVVLRHPDYDVATYLRPPAFDPSKLYFALSRGNATLNGRIVNELGSELPETVQLRLLIEGHNGWEPRREKTVPANAPFSFERLHATRYMLVATFPGSKISSRALSVDVDTAGTVDVELRLRRGVAIEGHLSSRAYLPKGYRVELLGPNALDLGQVFSDDRGFFRFDDLPPGPYRLKVWVGSTWFSTETIDVPESDPLGVKLVQIDCDLQRIKS